MDLATFTANELSRLPAHRGYDVNCVVFSYTMKELTGIDLTFTIRMSDFIDCVLKAYAKHVARPFPKPTFEQVVGSFARRRTLFSRSVALFLIELPAEHFRFEDSNVGVEQLGEALEWVTMTTQRRLWSKSSLRFQEIWRMHMDARGQNTPALAPTVTSKHDIDMRGATSCFGAPLHDFTQLLSHVKHESGPMPALPPMNVHAVQHEDKTEYTSLTDFIGRDLFEKDVEGLDAMLQLYGDTAPSETIKRPSTPEADARADSSLVRTDLTRKRMDPQELLGMLIAQGKDPTFIGQVMKSFST